MDCRPFFFKKFGMFHHRSTMRIGTDAVLFAQWVAVSSSDNVLDIGTGSGIIPMILSQKGAGSVDAVELDADSYEEAKLNFSISAWNEKLNVFNSDVRIFADEIDKKYDLIVSNPPFKLDFPEYRDTLAADGIRFWAGVPNAVKKVDPQKPKMAIYTCFIQHVLNSLKSTGVSYVPVYPIFSPSKANGSILSNPSLCAVYMFIPRSEASSLV